MGRIFSVFSPLLKKNFKKSLRESKIVHTFATLSTETTSGA